MQKTLFLLVLLGCLIISILLIGKIPEYKELQGIRFKLGEIYRSGDSVPQNYKKAAHWYEKSARQGYAEAQCILGMMYLEGVGVKQDDVKAFDLIKQAAEQGDAGAQYQLGLLYLKGKGVNWNFKKARYWTKKAANNSTDSIPEYVRNRTIKKKSKEGQQDYKEAARWYIEAGKHGDLESQEIIAVMYYEGKGVKKDNIKAYKWALLAEKNGDKDFIKLKEKLEKEMDYKQLFKARKQTKDFEKKK